MLKWGYSCPPLKKERKRIQHFNYPGIAPELSLDNPWIIHCPLIIPRVSIDYPWIIGGLSIDYPGIIDRISSLESSLDYPYIILGLSFNNP